MNEGCLFWGQPFYQTKKAPSVPLCKLDKRARDFKLLKS